MTLDGCLTFDEKLKLESWGIPNYILQKYFKRGIRCMFPWQVECLTTANVLNGRNLIYSAPTSAGKTLVAEILALQTVLEKKKKVIIILPFVSVVREKMMYFQDIFSGSGVRVEGFMGSYNPPGGFKAVHVAICTIEKANILVNRLLEEKSCDDIGCIVVDELHLLGDPHRGYLLELLLTKIKYVCSKGLSDPIQIVGMSATLPNLDVLADWLDAALYKTDFRPVPLKEYLKVNHRVYSAPNCEFSHELKFDYNIKNDPGEVISLCLDTILKGFSALVFCPTKNWCESLAQQVSQEIKRLGNSNENYSLALRDQLNTDSIVDLLEQLKKSSCGLDECLKQCVSFGVGFHHAGLTLDERDIIEGGFRQNTLRVLVATSTLSSGVNLPARRVIIRSPSFSGRRMDILTYKQMVGRAGRMGKDTIGESYLICTEDNFSLGKQLISSDIPSVQSCLGNDLSNSFKRAILEVLASGVVPSISEIEAYAKCTLLSRTIDETSLKSAATSCLNYLSVKGFVTIREDGLSVSSLAEACLSASFPPDQALVLLSELNRARQSFVLETDLHAVYQVTPFSICNQWSVDWIKVFTIWESLSTQIKNIGYLVGVEDRFMVRAMRGTLNLNSGELDNKIAVHKRFYTALALQDLINEVPLLDVADKFGCNKGMLQSLQQSASTFSGMVTNFCRKLNWGALEVVLSQLGQRIQFGVQKDLLDLLRLDCMMGPLARVFYNEDICSIADLARSNLKHIEKCVRKATPYIGDNSEEEMNRKKRNVYLPGRAGLTEGEAAELLLKEARNFIMREMGVKHVEWDATVGSEDSTIPPIGMTYDNMEEHYVSRGVLTTESNVKMTTFALVEEIGPKSEFQTPNSVQSTVSKFILKENKTSTPLSTVESAESPSLCELSDADMFPESPQVPRHAVTEPFEEFDSNRGGESLLETSQVQFKESSESFHKRKLAMVEAISPKRMKSEGISKFFSDSLDLNSFALPEIEGIQRKERVSVTDSFLELAFQDTFSGDSAKDAIVGGAANCVDNDSESLVSREIQQVQGKSPMSKLKSQPQSSPSKYPLINVSFIKSPSSKTTVVTPKKRGIKKFKSCDWGRSTDLAVELDPGRPSSQPSSSSATVSVCDSKESLKKFLVTLLKQKSVAFSIDWYDRAPSKRIGALITPDLEPTIAYDYTNENGFIKGVYFTWGEIIYYLDLKKSCHCRGTLKSILQFQLLEFWCYGAKDVLKLLYECTGVFMGGPVRDVAVADWLLCPNESRRTLNDLGKNYLKPIQLSVLDGLAPDVLLIWNLSTVFTRRLPLHNLMTVFTDVEMPTQTLLCAMELNGISFEKKLVEDLHTETEKVMRDLEKSAFGHVGDKFNLGSSKDLQRIKRTLGIKETDHQLWNIVTEWRKLNSLKTRNLSPLMRSGYETRCRGVCNTYTATGRIVMHDLNLQHIPRDFSIQNELFSMRSTFKASSGNLILAADYSQLELRILAHLSQDGFLISSINSSTDIFVSIASNWNCIPKDKVTDDIRQETKQIIYGIIYGMGDKTLGEALGVTGAEASMLAAKFRRTYPGIQDFITNCIQRCQMNGYITTLSGRVRFLPDINSSNTNLRRHAERQAVNSTIQGSAADISKKAALRIEAALNRVIPKRSSLLVGGPASHLVLQLHDEFIYEVHPEYLNVVANTVRTEMANAAQLSVPLPVVIKVGDSWGQLRKM